MDLRSVYFPTAHGNTLMEQDAILQGLAKILSGHVPLPVELCSTKDVADEQKALRSALIELAAGRQSLAVEIRSEQV